MEFKQRENSFSTNLTFSCSPVVKIFMILYITNIFLACMNSLTSRKTDVLAVFFKVDIFHLGSIKLECKLFSYLACISAKRISAESLRKILQHNLLSTCSSSYCKLSLYFCLFFFPPPLSRLVLISWRLLTGAERLSVCSISQIPTLWKHSSGNPLRT